MAGEPRSQTRRPHRRLYVGTAIWRVWNDRDDKRCWDEGIVQEFDAVIFQKLLNYIPPVAGAQGLRSHNLGISKKAHNSQLRQPAQTHLPRDEVAEPIVGDLVMYVSRDEQRYDNIHINQALLHQFVPARYR